MKGAAFAKGIGAKGLAAKGGFLKGIFGFFGGIIKLFFFGVFLIIFLIVGVILYFSMRKKFQSYQNNQNFQYQNRNPRRDDEEIIDAEIIENYPTRR
ncbi:MAG: hypothetical protein GXO62_05765 [Epsilonproteobacteria bacterium]|nr:hypothetical protein [Campylobacterota bacterium]